MRPSWHGSEASASGRSGERGTVNAGTRSARWRCLIAAGIATCVQPLHGQTPAVLTSNLVLTPEILAQRVSFESPADLLTVRGGAALAGRHFKDGEQALLWEWSTPEPLIFGELPGLQQATSQYPGGQPERLEPAYIGPSLQGGLKLWVYRESPNPDGHLVFQIGSSETEAEDNPAYRFGMQQNFSGWRALWVHFEEDAKVTDYVGAARMRSLLIKPSPDMVDDRVYLDMLQLVTFMSRKRHSDWHFENRKDSARVDQYRLLPAWRRIDQFAAAVDVTFDASDLDDAYNDLARIEQRYERLLLDTGGSDATASPASQSFATFVSGRVENANRERDALGIQRTADGVIGMPLFASRDEHPAELARTFQHVGEYVLAPLALDYRRSPSDAKKQRLLELLDHMTDQGWAVGSAIGTADHLIRVNPYANAVFLLRGELQQTGQLRDHQRAIAWYTRFGSLAELDTSIGENSDHIRGGAGPKLISVLLTEDSREKVARMRALRDYLVHVSDFAPGYADTIKPDYSLFHHAAAYQNVYGIQGVTTLAMLDWLLRGTRFALPEASTQRLRDTLMAQFDMAADFELHPALSGRFPYSNSGIDRFMMPGFAFAAMHDDRLVDPRLGGAFAWAYRHADLTMNFNSLLPRLNYYGSFGTLELMESAYRQAEQLPWEPPAGHFTFPYGAAATHKRPGWAAAVRGWSRYVWDWESGHQGENPYGRYFGFGSLLLFTHGTPLGLEASGIDLDGGFHWAYIPGATTKALPMSQVIYEIEPTAQYPEGKHRNFSTEAFAGGVSHGAIDGFYAISLRDTVPSDDEPLFDDSFQAKKSFLFVDNQIIALGSGIANRDDDHSTITTLFQSSIAGGPARVDGAEIETPHLRRYDGGLFTDPQANHYIVGPGQTVHAEQSEQQSLVPARRAGGSGTVVLPGHLPVTATYAKAWLDHGRAPTTGAYEYQILVQGDLDRARHLAANRNYRVHRKDSQAHIVEHLEKGLIAYAMFAPQGRLPGVIDAVDTPLLIMATRTGSELRLSVADPDLRLASWPRNMSQMPVATRNQPADPHVAALRLAGGWTLAQTHPDVISVEPIDLKTTVTILLDHGMTREILLRSTD